MKVLKEDVPVCQLDETTFLSVSENSFILEADGKRYYYGRLLEAIQGYILLILKRSPARRNDQIDTLITKLEKIETVMLSADKIIMQEWRQFVNDPIEIVIRSEDKL